MPRDYQTVQSDTWRKIRNWDAEDIEERAIPEVRQIIYDLRHPLTNFSRLGYRESINTVYWQCHFCGTEIPISQGYWCHQTMRLGKGPKLCHRCFLKFLLFIDHNQDLSLLFESMGEYHDEEIFWLARKYGKQLE